MSWLHQRRGGTTADLQGDLLQPHHEGRPERYRPEVHGGSPRRDSAPYRCCSGRNRPKGGIPSFGCLRAAESLRIYPRIQWVVLGLSKTISPPDPTQFSSTGR